MTRDTVCDVFPACCDPGSRMTRVPWMQLIGGWPPAVSPRTWGGAFRALASACRCLGLKTNSLQSCVAVAFSQRCRESWSGETAVSRGSKESRKGWPGDLTERKAEACFLTASAPGSHPGGLAAAPALGYSETPQVPYNKHPSSCRSQPDRATVASTFWRHLCRCEEMGHCQGEATGGGA